MYTVELLLLRNWTRLDIFFSFDASFATFSELQNDEKTRTFLTIEVGGGHNEVRVIDSQVKHEQR